MAAVASVDGVKVARSSFKHCKTLLSRVSYKLLQIKISNNYAHKRNKVIQALAKCL